MTWQSTNPPAGLPRPAHEGYTLLEMMIVVTILGIIGLMIIPVDTTEEMQVRAAAQMLAADISFAQVQSIGRADDRIVIVFDKSNRRYHLARQSDLLTPIIDPISKAPYRVQFGVGQAQELGDIRIHSVSLGVDDNLPFNRFGGVDRVGPLAVTLAVGGRKIMVRIDPVSGETSVVNVP